MGKTALLVGGAAAVLAAAAVAWIVLSGPKAETPDADTSADAATPDEKAAPALTGTGRANPKEAKAAEVPFRIRGHVVDATGAKVGDVPVRARRSGTAWDGSSPWGAGEKPEASFAKTLEGLDAPKEGRPKADGEAKSRADGSFEIAVSESGQYDVIAVPPPPRVGTQGWATVSLRNPTPEVTLTVKEGSALDGRVVDAQDKGMKAVVSASWSMAGTNQMWSVGSVKTDPATGAFRFEAVPEGKASLSVSLPGRAQLTGYTVTTPHEGVLTLRVGAGGGAIKGRVSSSEGEGIANADVTAWITAPTGTKAADAPSAGQFRGKSGPDGTYRIEAAIVGKVGTVQALAPGYVLHSSSTPTAPWSGAEVTANGDATVDVVLLKGGKVVGRIFESGSRDSGGRESGGGEPGGGAGVPDATVMLFRLAGGASIGNGQPISVSTDAQGRYAFDGVAIGKWLVLPQSPSHYLPALAATSGSTNAMWNPESMPQGPPPALVFVMTHEGETVTRDVEMKKGVPVSGRVVGSDGAAIAGARVGVNTNPNAYQAMWSWGINGYGNGAQDLATSGADGTFTIPGLAPQDACVLVARKEGLVGLPGEPFKASVASPPPAVTLKMVVGGTISGHVLDSDGKPVPSAYVYWWNPNGSSWGGPNNVQSDGDGAFTFRSVPEGKVTVSAQVQGFASAQKDLGAFALGENREGVELKLTRGVSLSGVVVDEAGNPVAGRQLWINPAGGGNGVNASSGDDGTFEAKGLPAGRVQVMVMDGRGQYSGNNPSQTFDAPGQGVRVVTTARKTTVVSGKVTDPVGSPVPLCNVAIRPKTGSSSGGVTTYVQGPNSVVMPGGSGAWSGEIVNGDFRQEVEGMPPFEVTASAARDANAQPMNLKSKTTTVADPASGPVVIVLEAGLEIAGRVLGPDDVPLEGVTVRAGGPATSTDAKGAFRFGGLEPGEVAVTTGPLRSLLAAAPTKVKAGTTDLVLRLTAGLAVAGQVFGPDGKPYATCGVSVQWQTSGPGPSTPPSGSLQAQPSPDGRFRLEPIPDLRGSRVTVTVQCWSPGGSGDVPRQARLTDVRPGTEDLAIHLEAGVAIEGRLVGPTGDGIANANLQAQLVPQPGRAGGSHGWAQTDAEGSFTMGGLEPGTYTVSAWFQAGGMTLEAVKIDAPARGVRLTAVKTQSIEGRVEGSGDLAGFRVSARSSLPNAMYGGQQAAATDASGRFKIDGVGTGTYRVTASKGKDDRYGLLEGVKGGTTGVVVGLEMGGSIEGTFDDAAGQPVTQGSVGASNDTWQTWTSVDADGRFRIAGLPPGTYKVTGSKRGPGAGAVVEGLQPGATNVRLRLPGS